MKLTAILALGAVAGTAWAQSIVSARSGLIHYTEGTVFLGEQKLASDPSTFPEAGLNELLRVGDGRAEVLLTPGAVLRLGADSALRMLANRLDDTRVALLAGTALIEIDALLDDNRIGVMIAQGYEVQLLKRGLYHFNADTGEFRVYDGKAEVSRSGEETVSLKKGRSVSLAQGLDVEKFETKQKDDVYLWSQYRSQVMARINMSAANTVDRKALVNNIWYLDSWTGMYTFLPARGTVRSPFGWTWYSPSTIWIVYSRPVTWSTYSAQNSGGGGATWTGISSTNSSSAASAVAADPGVAVRSDSGASAAPVSAGGGRSR